MGQVTLQLDDDVLALMDEAVKLSGVSPGRWLSDLIRKQAAQQWPADILAMAGSLPDFPLREDWSSEQTPDIDRIGIE